MANLFRLTLVDFKYVVKTKELWIALGIISIYTLGMFAFTLDSETSYTTEFFYQLIHDLLFYVLILLLTVTLSKEYTFKTTRILFTGRIKANHLKQQIFFDAYILRIGKCCPSI